LLKRVSAITGDGYAIHPSFAGFGGIPTRHPDGIAPGHRLLLDRNHPTSCKRRWRPVVTETLPAEPSIQRPADACGRAGPHGRGLIHQQRIAHVIERTRVTAARFDTKLIDGVNRDGLELVGRQYVALPGPPHVERD